MPGEAVNGPVAVALSGGRDSLLALALLKEAGRDVIGVHGRFLDDAPGRMPHAALADELTARCDGLGAPFHSIDLRGEFTKLVIEPFISSYAAGRTPSPCCLCNAALKFGLLLDRAAALGAARIATGHYARLAHEMPRTSLSRGEDAGKDQSYFLCLVPQERLARAEFPLAGWNKAQVLDALQARGLPPPLPGESQEVCFVPGDDYQSFLQTGRLPLPGPGPILLRDPSGAEREVGRHKGLWRHTEGQRRGLGVAHAEPLYVLAKDAGRNALIVGAAPQARCAGVRASRLNLLVPPQEWPEHTLAKCRSRQDPAPARAVIDAETLTIDFTAPCALPAPGQIAALYDEDGRVLAGGVIDAVRTAD